MCNEILDPTCIPGQILQDAATGVLDTIATQLGEFVAVLIKNVVAGWLTIPSPQVASSADAALRGETIGAVAQLRAHTWWITAALAVGSLLFAAARIAVNRNGREAAEVARGLVQLVVLSGLGVPVVLLLTEIGDIYTDWIINRATGGQFEQRLITLTVLSSPAAVNPLPKIAVIICGLILTITFLVQIMLMFGRAVALVILTGALPALAAGGMAGRATQSRDKAVAWLVVFVIYKPSAGTAYAVGFWLIGEGTSLNDILAGMMTFLIALVALPALMRLISPALDRLSAGAGSGAMEGLAVGAAVATGAATVGAAVAGIGRRGGGGGGAEAATGAAAAGTSAVPVAGMATAAVEQVGKRAQQVAQTPQKAATVIGQTGATGAGGAR